MTSGIIIRLIRFNGGLLDNKQSSSPVTAVETRQSETRPSLAMTQVFIITDVCRRGITLMAYFVLFHKLLNADPDPEPHHPRRFTDPNALIPLHSSLEVRITIGTPSTLP